MPRSSDIRVTPISTGMRTGLPSGPLNGNSQQIVSTVRLIVPLTDSEPSHLVLQGRTLKTQTFGRSAVTRDLPGRRLQCLEDDFPLGFMEGRGRARNVVKMRDLKLGDWHF